MDAASALWTPWPPSPRMKSSARLFFTRPSVRMSFWAGTPRVHDTVTVLSQDPSTTVLGTAFGSREQINARAWESVRACDETRLGDHERRPRPAETVLTRQCADVSKLTCCMRASMETFWTMTCWLLVMGNSSLPSAPPSAATCRITHSRWQATTGSFVWRPWPSHIGGCWFPL